MSTTEAKDGLQAPSAMDEEFSADTEESGQVAPPDAEEDEEEKSNENEASNAEDSDRSENSAPRAAQTLRPQRPMTAGATALAIGAGLVQATARRRATRRELHSGLKAERIQLASQRNTLDLAEKAALQVKRVEQQVARHDTTYRPFYDLVRKNMEDPKLQKEKPKLADRRKMAIERAEAVMPEFNGKMAKAKYDRSREMIESSVKDLTAALRDLGGVKMGGEVSPEAADYLRSLHDKLDTDSPYQKAARAATMDGQEDEGWKKKMEEFAKEAMEAIKEFFNSLLAMIGLKQKPASPGR